MYTPQILGQVIINGLGLSFIYILIALGFTLLFGIMRVVNFAHGSFVMLGGFALYYMYSVYELPFLVALVAAMLAVAIPSLILERFVFRHFYNDLFRSLIGLMGLDMAIVYSSVIIWDVYERSIPSATSTVFDWEGIFVPMDRIIVIGVTGVALLCFWLFVSHTRLGTAMRATAQDSEVARSMGVRVKTIYAISFFIAILMTAMAGGLYAQTYAVSPFMGERPLVIAFIVVILGGLGSIPGAALGGLILGMADSFLSTYFGAAVSSFASFGAVIILLVIRPWGLLGKPE